MTSWTIVLVIATALGLGWVAILVRYLMDRHHHPRHRKDRHE